MQGCANGCGWSAWRAGSWSPRLPRRRTASILYYDFHEPLHKIAGHRVLAVNRGEREEFLKVSIRFDREKALRIVESAHVQEGSPCTAAVRAAAADAYDRLIFPSIERELRGQLTESASDAAIRVFSVNLRQLLMQPPVKGRVTLGLIRATAPAANARWWTAPAGCWTPASSILRRPTPSWRRPGPG